MKLLKNQKTQVKKVDSSNDEKKHNNNKKPPLYKNKKDYDGGTNDKTRE